MTTRLCLNCRTILTHGQLKFCSRLCEKRSQRQQQLARDHSITKGNIEIIARLGENNRPEWILPGCIVTRDRRKAEQTAATLSRLTQ